MIKLMIPRLAKVTINPAIRTPPAIIGKAYQKRIPNKKAATEPVHTPVTGKGIAIKNKRKIAPYFSYFNSCLLVLVNSQVKNISNICHFLKKSDNGSRYSSKKAAGIRFPRTAKI